MMSNFPVVVQVIPQDNYHVMVFFEDGKIVDYDMSNDLDGVFEPLRDIEVFKNACTVLNDSLAWDLGGNRDEYNCLDIDPCVLYKLEATNNEVVV